VPAGAPFVLAVAGVAANRVVGSCTIHPDLLVASMRQATSHAELRVSIPFREPLSDQALHAQAFALDPEAALLGIASATRELRVTIGDRRVHAVATAHARPSSHAANAACSG
jgi:hypothetical protein